MDTTRPSLVRWRGLPIVCAGAVAVALAGSTPSLKPEVTDPDVYLDAVHRMRGGEGYYDAMDAALRAAGIGPVESVRAMRMPTWFVLARWVPSDRLLWWAFLAMMVVCVVLVTHLVRRPVTAVATAGLMALIGLEGYTFPDVWCVPLVLGAVLAARRQRWWLAIALATGATAIREVAALALVALAVEMVRTTRRWMPPLLALAAAAAMGLAHAHAVGPYLVAEGQGREAQLIGSSHGLSSVASMASAWVPGGIAIGVPLYLLAVWSLRRSPLLCTLGVWLALPLVGVVVHRIEWGALVTPVAMALGLDALADLVGRGRSQTVPVDDSIGEQPSRSTSRIRKTLTVSRTNTSSNAGFVRSRSRWSTPGAGSAG